MNTENTREENIIDLGAFDIETKGNGGTADDEPGSSQQQQPFGLIAD